MGDHADDLMFQEMGLTLVEATTYKCGYCKQKLGENRIDAQKHVNDCAKKRNLK